MNNRIIIIDDEESILKDYSLILSPPEAHVANLEKTAAALETELFGGSSKQPPPPPRESYDLTTALQGEEGFNKIREARERALPFAMAFIDIRMPPGWDGLQTAKMIREVDKEIEIVMVTAYSDRNRQEIVERVGMPERLLYLKKPFDPDEVRQLAMCLTRKWDLERKTERRKDYLERLLTSVRRLKTLSILSVREVLSAILNEVLYFIDARKGFIAQLEGGDVRVEITSEDLTPFEIKAFVDRISDRLPKVERVSWIDDIMIFPLKNGIGDLFILISTSQNLVSEERINLLRLLLETCSDVLESMKKQERYLKNERIATIGQVAAGIIHDINNPLQAIISVSNVYSRQGQELQHFLEAFCYSIFGYLGGIWR